MDDLFVDPSSTREAILGAAFRALCEHGYADLTIEAIGAEFEKSPSLLYHHYENKDDLLVGLLEYLLEEFEGSAPTEDLPDDPADQLELFVDRNIAIDPDENRMEAFLVAVIELRAQATHNEAYRDHFDRSDRVFHQILADTIREGLETGSFTASDVDPDAVAATLLTIGTGAAFHWGSTSNRDWMGGIPAETRRYLQARLHED